MFKFRKQFLIGLTALSIGAVGITAYADSAAPSAEQQAKFAEHMAKRQAKLHDDLKITPAQEGAWQTFIAKMKPTMPAPSAQRPSKEELAKQTAPERLEHEADFLKRAQARLAARTAAVKEFYPVLTPEQQKVFDEHFRKMHHGRFGHHGFGRDHQEGGSAAPH
ncbi:Spy/CpxP family protein refolding chaperone [Paraherbaspirillum soli]|uniref:Spy/CpxP family protein refolding chaperone n=1 Tax=Paraherbaspirillum soli TaxID=631222 RepID=A0ABW0M769_9BURK